jgi:hypothetical protein
MIDTGPRNRDWKKVPAKYKNCEWLKSYIAIVRPVGTISCNDFYAQAPDNINAPATWTEEMKATAVRSVVDILEDLGAIRVSSGQITWIGGDD